MLAARWIINETLYGAFCTRLLQHAVALRQLSHRNIAAVYDAFSAVNYSADSVDAEEQASSVSVYVVQVTVTQDYFIHCLFHLSSPSGHYVPYGIQPNKVVSAVNSQKCN